MGGSTDSDYSILDLTRGASVEDVYRSYTTKSKGVSTESKIRLKDACRSILKSKIDGYSGLTTRKVGDSHGYHSSSYPVESSVDKDEDINVDMKIKELVEKFDLKQFNQIFDKVEGVVKGMDGVVPISPPNYRSLIPNIEKVFSESDSSNPERLKERFDSHFGKEHAKLVSDLADPEQEPVPVVSNYTSQNDDNVVLNDESEDNIWSYKLWTGGYNLSRYSFLG